MFPRQQTAGTLGIASGVTLAILFLLFMTSGITPDTIVDPAKAIARITQDSGRFRAIAVVARMTVAFAAIFVAGLAARLREKTPTRATGVLYFGILGLVGHGLGALVFWAGVPLLVARAAVDQASAGQAWVALNVLSAAFDGFGNLFIGLSTVMAGWAITNTPEWSSALGWFGVVAGVLTVAAMCEPTIAILTLAAFVLPIIWLLWAGNALRTAT